MIDILHAVALGYAIGWMVAPLLVSKLFAHWLAMLWFNFENAYQQIVADHLAKQRATEETKGPTP